MSYGRPDVRLVLALFLILPAAGAGIQAQAAVSATPAPLPMATPESVGLSAAGLEEMDAGMQGLVDRQHLAGAVTLVARHGKVVHHKAHGVQDLATKAPMQLDTITRIASMTKPVTGVAMLMLYEEGKWQPSDPIAKHIPEFANLKVYAGDDAKGAPILEPPVHPPTMGELMSHTAGFTYGSFGNTAVDKMYQASQPLGARSLQAFITRMATLPLLYQPGSRWVYSVGVDIQGYLVEKLSGQTFPDFLRTRLFEPLGMIDTAFFVPAAKLPRLATAYSWSASSAALAPIPRNPDVSRLPGLPSGGGGWYSTAADYFRFAQMLLNGGELNGVRILKAATVQMMRTNVLSEAVLNSNSGISQARFSPAQGFGYDVAVVLDPAGAKRQVGVGSYWWWGHPRDMVLDRPDERPADGGHHPTAGKRAGCGQSRRDFTQCHRQRPEAVKVSQPPHTFPTSGRYNWSHRNVWAAACAVPGQGRLQMTHHDHHDDFGGLHRDLFATGQAINRRSWLRLAARIGSAAGAVQLVGCGGESPTSPSSVTGETASSSNTGTTTTTPPTGTSSCSRIPEETAGPYPGDGSNGPTVLSLGGVVRSDIRSSFGGLSGTADGVALTLSLTLVSASTCEPLAGRAVYLWHCDRQGRYSLYSSGVTNQNFLRGVQEADGTGRVSFTTIFPGCYAGRWPHIHFEIFPSLAAATSVANKIATSQLALPKDACDAVYASGGYESSITNLSRITLASDNVFSDGSSLQLATTMGSPATGYTSTLSLAVNA